MRTVLAAALLAAAAGCGGGDEGGATATTVPAGEYAQRADELCGRVAADVSELDVEHQGRDILAGSGSDEDKFNRLADLIDDQLQILIEFREDVEALGRPSTGADDVDQILDKTRSAESELGRAVAALRDGDEQEFAEAMQRYASYSLQSASIARDSELDFAVCGAGA